MYDITITVSTAKDPATVAQQIAAIVESATGEQCRVSVLNKRNENEYLMEQKQSIVKELESKGQYANTNRRISQ